MHFWEVIILGIIQGFTEFLPVSSSGHLVLAQSLLGMNSPGVVVEVVLHLGTLVSILIVYWQDVIGIFRGLFSLITNPSAKRRIPKELATYRRMVMLLILGTIPTGIFGILLEPLFSSLFDSLLVVGVALLVTGVVLFFTSRIRPGKRDFRKMGALDALVVGLAQGLAITPGLSRSGMTISSALSRGLNRETATRFSFLLSIPAIGGATVLQFRDILGETTQMGNAGMLFVGFLAAAIAGVLAIKLLVSVLKQGKLQYFAYYVWIIGLLAIWRAW